jgi:hypothetical protein
VVNKKTEHVSLRLPKRLYDMVEEISLLFGGNFTEALCEILKDFEFSPKHKEMLDKLSVMRFYVIMRNAEIRNKLEEIREKKKDDGKLP